jgi:hypothetical protein
LLAAENAGKNKTDDAKDAFTTIRNQLGRCPMTTPDSQKLLSAFKGVDLRDRTATATIQSVDEKSSPPVSVLCNLISNMLKVYHQPKAGPRKKISFVLLKSLGRDEPPDIVHSRYPSSPQRFPRLKENIQRKLAILHLLHRFCCSSAAERAKDELPFKRIRISIAKGF